MDNRILHLDVRNGSLMPAQSEVWIRVVPEWQSPTTELRGRLMGPRCPYASTVEVAYPLRPTPQRESSDRLTARVVIPEASLWDTESPFLYRGPIELWQDGRCCERIVLCHGLRSVLLGERGLSLNGKPMSLRGQTVASCTEAEALKLRENGCNLLIVPVEESTLSLWERADRLGFHVLGQLKDGSEKTLKYLNRLHSQPSCLGWLVEKGIHPPLDLLPPRCLVGLVCDETAPSLPLWTGHFLFGPAELANLGKALLVKGETSLPLVSGSILGHAS